MRIKKNGQRWFMDESIQRQAELAEAAGNVVPTDRELLHTHMQQALGNLDWFAPRCKASEVLPVVTVRAALRLLIEYLEGSK